MFKLKKPCKNCPFRNDLGREYRGWLNRSCEGIKDSLIYGKTFTCHKTTSSNDEEEEDYKNRKIQKGEQFCAGALILMHKSGDAKRSRSIMQATHIFRLLDSKQLDMNAPVFNNFDEFIEFHKGS